MAAVNRVYAARLAGMVVLGPDGESIGRVRDVVISIGVSGHQPRVLGLVVELLTRRRIFVPDPAGYGHRAQRRHPRDGQCIDCADSPSAPTRCWCSAR